MVDIVVLSRRAIENWQPDRDCAIISIHNPGDTAAKLPDSPYIKHTLLQAFSDITDEEFMLDNCILPAEEHAKAILEFAIKAASHVNLIICQCDAGISRSAGAAAGLQLAMGMEDTISGDPSFHPNILIKRLIIDAAKGLNHG